MPAIRRVALRTETEQIEISQFEADSKIGVDLKFSTGTRVQRISYVHATGYLVAYAASHIPLN